LAPQADSAKLRLQAMNKPVPDVDPVAYARERYELENREKRGFLGKALVPFSSHPDLLLAAKSGPPSMEGLRPTIPASVPLAATGTLGTSATPGAGTPGNGEVTGVIVDKSNLVDKLPDARLSMTPDAAAPAPSAPAAAPSAGAPAAPAAPLSKPEMTPAAPAATPTPTAPNGKTKTLAQQESDLKREQAQIRKEKQKIQDQQKKQIAIMQAMNKRQQAAMDKKKAEEDADRKRAEKAAAKKAGKQAPAKPAPETAPAATPAQPGNPGNSPGGGESPSAKP
jgi:hypothetical protein